MIRASVALAHRAVLAASPLAADPLSRAEAVRLALEANPDVKKAEENMNRLHGFVTEARADALPELKAFGQWTRFRDPSFLNSPSFDNFPPEFIDQLKPVPASLWDGYATLKQTLWSFKVGRAIKAAKLATQSGTEEIRRVQQAVALLAVQAYNDYLLGLERVGVAKQAVTQKEKQLETTRNRRAAGVATDLDVLRFEVDLENARVQQLSEEGQADLARGRLNAVLVRPIGAPVEPTDRLEYVAMDVSPEEAVAEAWSRRPEVKQVDLEERIRDYAVGIAKADSPAEPRLQRELRLVDPQDLGLLHERLPEVVRGRRAHRARLRRPAHRGQGGAGPGREEHGGPDRIALENQIRLEAKDAVDRLSVAKRVLQATELNVQQSQKALEMVQANYKFGAATLLDVIDAQAAQTVADSNRIQALYVHANARAKLRFVMAREPLDPPSGAPAPPPRRVARTTWEPIHEHDSPFRRGARRARSFSSAARTPPRRRAPRSPGACPCARPRWRAATSTRRWCSPEPCARGPRCRWWPSSRPASCKVLRDEGARAAAGETLAVLDDTDYRLAHDRVQAALALAEANRSPRRWPRASARRTC